MSPYEGNIPNEGEKYPLIPFQGEHFTQKRRRHAGLISIFHAKIWTKFSEGGKLLEMFALLLERGIFYALSFESHVSASTCAFDSVFE